MAYSNSPGPAMGASTSSGGSMPDGGNMPDDASPDSGGEGGEKDSTFFLPPDMVSKYDCQPGDKIHLEVVSVDKDGDKEVKITGVDHGEDKGMSMMDDLRANKDKIMPEPASTASMTS